MRFADCAALVLARSFACLLVRAVFYNKEDAVYNYFNKERNEWCEYKREEIRLKSMKISTAAVSACMISSLLTKASQPASQPARTAAHVTGLFLSV